VQAKNENRPIIIIIIIIIIIRPAEIAALVGRKPCEGELEHSVPASGSLAVITDTYGNSSQTVSSSRGSSVRLC
jgi:hypothetical protein